MAKSNTKISYDSDEDIFDISKGIQSKSSIEVGDFIIDIDFNNNVSAIEILNASEHLNISKETLKSVESANLSVIYKPDSTYIMLLFNFKDISREVIIPLTINFGHDRISQDRVLVTK